MRINLGEEDQPEIGLIALMDCIIFLLMFFMVATTFKQQSETEKRKTLPLELPQSAASLDPATAAEPALVIGIDKTGRLYTDGAPLSVVQLQARLHAVAARDAGQRIRIDGDRQTAYQHIVRVLDLCQFEGLTNVSMHARE